jgi:hypothetical protein
MSLRRLANQVWIDGGSRAHAFDIESRSVPEFVAREVGSTVPFPEALSGKTTDARGVDPPLSRDVATVNDRAVGLAYNHAHAGAAHEDVGPNNTNSDCTVLCGHQ